MEQTSTKRAKRHNRKHQLDWSRVKAAAAALSGDPQFIAFLDAVADVREAAVRSSQLESTVRDHQCLTFNAAVTYAMDTILDAAAEGEHDQTTLS